MVPRTEVELLSQLDFSRRVEENNRQVFAFNDIGNRDFVVSLLTGAWPVQSHLVLQVVMIVFKS